MRHTHFFLLLFAAFLAGCGSTTTPLRQTFLFDDDWLFSSGDTLAASPGFDDSGWEHIQLPHDFSVLGEIENDNPSGTAGGFFPGGTAWYRKHFELDASKKAARVFLDFDGVYRNADVYINGKLVGNQKNGYVSFGFDITPFVRFDTVNVVAVRVDNSLQPFDRWYPGSGIYRHVWLTYTAPIYIPKWGTYITSRELTEKQATISIETQIHNLSGENPRLLLKTEVFDRNNKSVAVVEDELKVNDDTSQLVNQELTILNPVRWEPESPVLYKAVSTIMSGKTVVDRYETTFGLRTVQFDANQGFILNGRKVMLKGVNIHHDGGCVGAAVPDSLWLYRLKVLKGLGCNAIRLSHNPHAPVILSLCDSLGLIVVDEMYDKWALAWQSQWLWKNQRDTLARWRDEFNATWQNDMKAWIVRDRNHPSVVVWSMGNETVEQLNDPQAGVDILNRLTAFARTCDPSRELTCVMHPADEKPGHEVPSRMVEHLGIVGYNYRSANFADWHRQHPDVVWFASETLPYAAWNPDFSTLSFSDNSWFDMDTFVAGQFIWAGIDYLGESMGWPDKGFRHGIVDLCNRPKPYAFFTQSVYSDIPMVHVAVLDPELADSLNRMKSWQKSWAGAAVVDHWNFDKNGAIMQVATFSNCPEVELLLNHKSLGKKMLADFPDKVIKWEVPYEAGTLKAVATDKEGKTHEHILQTAAEPVKIRISPHKTKMSANGSDLLIIEVSAVDSMGVLCPFATNTVEIKFSGDGRLLGIENGDLADHTHPLHMERALAGGRLILLIQSTKTAGYFQIGVASAGLERKKITVRTEK